MQSPPPSVVVAFCDVLHAHMRTPWSASLSTSYHGIVENLYVGRQLGNASEAKLLFPAESPGQWTRRGLPYLFFGEDRLGLCGGLGSVVWA